MQRTPSSQSTTPKSSFRNSKPVAEQISKARKADGTEEIFGKGSWIRLQRNHGEDVLSLALRVAETNGFLTMLTFSSESGIGRGELAKGRKIASLANIAGCDEDFLTSDTILTVRKGLVLAGERLHRYQWSSTSRRFCPKCFADDLKLHRHDLTRPKAWGRVWWNMPDIMTCHIHDVMLRTTCECGREVGWSNASVATCICGRSLAEAACTDARCDADGYIVGRLRYTKPLNVPTLDGMALSDAIRAVRIFSEAAAPDMENRVLARQLGFGLLARGETGVAKILGIVANQSGLRPGSITRFGPVYAFARDMRPAPIRDQLIELMRTNVNINDNRSRSGKRATSST